MDSFVSFDNKILACTEKEYLEKYFGIIIGKADLDTPIVFPNLRTTVCSCNVNNKHLATDINNFIICDNLSGSFNCPICRCDESPLVDDLSSPNIIVHGFSCTHNFHFECISSWLKNNNTCPICLCDWSYCLNNNNDKISVKFNDQLANFVCEKLDDGNLDVVKTVQQIYDHFGVDMECYRLTQNKKYVDISKANFKAGQYNLCTVDAHAGSEMCIEIHLSTDNNKYNKKLIIKRSTKIAELKNEVANDFGTIPEKIMLIINENIRLGLDFNDLNIFNVGATNNSKILVEIDTKIDYGLWINGSFVVVYAMSHVVNTEPANLYSQILDQPSHELSAHSKVETDVLRKMLMGCLSFYPSAYYPNITDNDMANFLSSLYILCHSVGKNQQMINRVVDNLKNLIVAYNGSEILVQSFSLLLNRSLEFHDANRTILSAGIYELIYNIKTKSGCTDGKILSEANVLFDVLYSTNPGTVINWNFAKKNLYRQKIFNIYSPIALGTMEPPLLTYNNNSQVAVYTGKGKNIDASLNLYCCLSGMDLSENAAELAKKLSLDTTLILTDDRICEEAIVICIDTSKSMGELSDFDEDRQMRKKNKHKNEDRHYDIWNNAVVDKTNMS